MLRRPVPYTVCPWVSQTEDYCCALNCASFIQVLTFDFSHPISTQLLTRDWVTSLLFHSFQKLCFFEGMTTTKGSFLFPLSPQNHNDLVTYQINSQRKGQRITLFICWFLKGWIEKLYSTVCYWDRVGMWFEFFLKKRLHVEQKKKHKIVEALL